MEYTILTCNLLLLRDTFDKLNIKCQKYGNPILDYTIIDKQDTYTKIFVSGCTPIVGDYHLVGIITKLEDGTNCIQSVPGKTIPPEYIENNFFCDHCKTNRYRKEVVIVGDKNGNYKQLGKTCLKDYLGIDLENIVSQFEYINDTLNNLRENYGPRELLYVTPKEYLIKTAICVRQLGYTPTNSQDGIPTKNLAFNLSFPDSKFLQFVDDHKLYQTEKDEKLAISVLNWIKANTSQSEFIINAKNIVNQEFVQYQHCGYLAGLIPAYKKDNPEKKPIVYSEFVGTIGERIECSLLCQRIIHYDSIYGKNYILIFKDIKQNEYVWFTSSFISFEEGENYICKFTIKNHNEYKGVKQNVISRVKKV